MSAPVDMNRVSSASLEAPKSDHSNKDQALVRNLSKKVSNTFSEFKSQSIDLIVDKRLTPVQSAEARQFERELDLILRNSRRASFS